MLADEHFVDQQLCEEGLDKPQGSARHAEGQGNHQDGPVGTNVLAQVTNCRTERFFHDWFLLPISAAPSARGIHNLCTTIIGAAPLIPACAKK